MNGRARYLFCIAFSISLIFIQSPEFQAAQTGRSLINTIPDPDAFIPSDDMDDDEPEQATASNAGQATAANAHQVLSPLIPADTDIVSSEQELINWISNYGSNGGTVHLGETITLTDLLYLNSYDITIDTGSYGIVLDPGAFYGTSFDIIGEGVTVPVVDVIRGDFGYPWDPSWNSHLMQLRITATGKDGKGGTALRIRKTDHKSFEFMNIDTFPPGMIRSYGKNAVGLWLDTPTETYCYRIEVEGENSTAVYAPNGGDFYYCLLKAEGDGASAVSGGDIVLDTCSVTPDADNAKNLTRSFLTDEFTYLYLPLEQDCDQSLFHIYDYKGLVLPLSGGSGYEPVRRSFPVDWDLDAYFDIDTGTIGTISIRGSLCESLLELGLDSIELTLNIDIRPTDIPCIRYVVSIRNDTENYFELYFWDSYDPTDDNIILWRSDDQGVTWWDATWSDDIIWDGYSLVFTYDTLEHPVRLALELVGMGESNIVELSSEGNGLCSNIGGDRTGTDREPPDPPGDLDDTNSGDGDDDKEPGGDDDNKPGGDDDNKPGSNYSGGNSSAQSAKQEKPRVAVTEDAGPILPFPDNESTLFISENIAAAKSLPDINPAGEAPPAIDSDQPAAANAPVLTHETNGTQAPVPNPQTAAVPVNEETSVTVDAESLPNDSGQAGPPSTAPTPPAIPLLLGIAALCSGLLLLLRIIRR